jgi:D-xylose transport system permease protein
LKLKKSRALPSAEKAFSPRDFSMVFALITIWGFFAVATPNFVSARNLSNLAVELSITAVLALGMLLIILTGHIDLSVGSGVGLLGGIAAVLVYERGMSAPLAMLVALLVALVVWVGMGAIIVSQRIPAFIITLAGLMVFKGLHWQVIHNATIPVTVGGQENLYSLLTTWYLPPLWSWVLGGAAFAAMVVMQLRERSSRAALGFANPAPDLAFSRLLITGQIILLFVLVCNQFRGIPLSAIIWRRRRWWCGPCRSIRAWAATSTPSGATKKRRTFPAFRSARSWCAPFAIMGAITALGGFLQTLMRAPQPPQPDSCWNSMPSRPASSAAPA